ncbi:hypothetical protein BDP27DRAFT_514220 [Rhodocollybia butyracea]|uniref:Uncharacterized protein n=1 Tax=Rhodocollybia butyracea TaxID=206335 RepID=A0A9P5TXY8_9AGAR|nr:hypothetical protein BDP27DRAFT_514220 [Rhodocollybia butyracea]
MGFDNPFGFGGPPPFFGGGPPFGGPPPFFGGLPPDPALFNGGPPPNVEALMSGMLLNVRNFQVADVQKWSFSPAQGSEDESKMYIKSHVLTAGGTNFRYSASPSNMGSIELTEFQEPVWTISVVGDTGQLGLVGKSLRYVIFSSTTGTDLYWTMDSSTSPGRIFLQPYNKSDADAQTWILEG